MLFYNSFCAVLENKTRKKILRKFLIQFVITATGCRAVSPRPRCLVAALHLMGPPERALMGPLLLQTPGQRSKPAELKATPQRRLDLWEMGDFEALISECRAIQSRLPKKTETPDRPPVAGYTRQDYNSIS